MKETWKKISWCKTDYEVSSLGEVRSSYKIIKKSCGKTYTRVSKVLKPANEQGYLRVGLSVGFKLTSKRVHRLVAEMFIENPLNKPEVNHINGVKHDNRVVNLEWCTHNENIKHAVKNGLVSLLRGEEIGNSILTEQNVLNIRKEFTPRIVTRKFLAAKYGVKECTIKDVLQRRSWKHI